MPKFGFYMQDLIPWGQDTHGRYPGEQVGCELALRRRGDGESEVYIKDMVRGGPAALTQMEDHPSLLLNRHYWQ